MEHRERKGSLFGPLLLIFIGVLFLLNNLGVLPWDIWLQLLRLWPIFLIGAGLDLLLGRRSILGSLVVAVLVIALLVGGLAFITSRTPSTPAQTQEVSYALQDADQADLRIDFGAGTLRIGALPESNRLLEGTVDLSKGETLDDEHTVQGGKASLRLESDRSTPLTFPNDWNQDKTWDLRINREVRLALQVDTGVGVAEMDLRKLKLDTLRVNSGVGKTTLILPERGRFDARVDCGLGQVVIEIPEGMEARIQVNSGLGDVQVPAGYRRSGDTRTSPNFDSAENRVELSIEGGVGQIVIREHKEE